MVTCSLKLWFGTASVRNFRNNGIENLYLLYNDEIQHPIYETDSNILPVLYNMQETSAALWLLCDHAVSSHLVYDYTIALRSCSKSVCSRSCAHIGKREEGNFSSRLAWRH